MDFETIKSYYERGLWSAPLVLIAVRKGILTQEQANEILSLKEE